MKRLRRHPWLALGAFVLLCVLLMSAALLRGYGLYQEARQAYGHLQEAQRAAEAGGFGLTAKQAHQAATQIGQADVSLARLAAALKGDPLVTVLRVVPGGAEQLDAASAMVRAGRLITSRHAAIAQMLDAYVAAQGGRQGPERLAALARFVAETRVRSTDLIAAFTEAEHLVAGVSPRGLVAPLAQIHASMADQLQRAHPLVGAWQIAQEVLPSAMGVRNPKRYIVFALDNAEVRPIGGLIAAFATPSFRSGLLSDLRFRDILDIDKVRQKTYVRPPQPLAGHLLGNVTWQVADAGWWPEFKLSASEARRLYAIETGDTRLDGTIAFTPELVDAFLRIVGPVEIPGAGITVHPGETYLVSLEQAEVLHTGPGRKQFLAQLASEVMNRLFALPADRYPEVLQALDRAGKRRELQIFLDDPAAQAAIEALGWYTPFAFPHASDRLAIMEANVAPVSKLHVLVDLNHALDVRLRPDGNADERLVTTYTNRFGPDLPAQLRAVGLAFRSGNLGTYQRRYLVPGAQVLSVSSDRPPRLTAPERIESELGSLAVGNYVFVRPGVTHLETRYFAPQVVISEVGDPARQGTYRLSFWKQAGRDRDTLSVRVTVPPGTHPVSWSEGGIVSGPTVSFATTTELDRTFEVRYAAD